jgi:hypothetical protein
MIRIPIVPKKWHIRKAGFTIENSDFRHKCNCSMSFVRQENPGGHAVIKEKWLENFARLCEPVRKIISDLHQQMILPYICFTNWCHAVCCSEWKYWCMSTILKNSNFKKRISLNKTKHFQEMLRKYSFCFMDFQFKYNYFEIYVFLWFYRLVYKPKESGPY